MSTAATDLVTLSRAQLGTIITELESALDGLEQLAHLCSVQAHSSRVEEAVGAALYVLRTAAAASAEQP